MWSARRTIGLVLIAIGVSWWLVRRAPSARQLDPPSILTQVRQLNQLATVKYTVQKVVAIREQKQPVGSESILLILQASVEAGINLAALRPEDVSVGSDGAVVIRLPHAQVDREDRRVDVRRNGQRRPDLGQLVRAVTDQTDADAARLQ